MNDLHITTAGQLVEFLEKYIELYGNPTTQEQWADCMKRMSEEGQAQYLGSTEMSAGYIAGSLRDEGVNAHKLKVNKEGEDK